MQINTLLTAGLLSSLMIGTLASQLVSGAALAVESWASSASRAGYF